MPGKNAVVFVISFFLLIIIVAMGTFVLRNKKAPTKEIPASMQAASQSVIFTDDLNRPIQPGYSVQSSDKKNFTLVATLVNSYLKNKNVYITLQAIIGGIQQKFEVLLLTPSIVLSVKKTNSLNIIGRREKSAYVSFTGKDTSLLIQTLQKQKGNEIVLIVPLYVITPSPSVHLNPLGSNIINEARSHLDCNIKLSKSIFSSSLLDNTCIYYSNILTIYDKTL